MAIELLDLRLAFRALSDEDPSDEEGVVPDNDVTEDDDELEDPDMAKPDLEGGDEGDEKIEE